MLRASSSPGRRLSNNIKWTTGAVKKWQSGTEPGWVLQFLRPAPLMTVLLMKMLMLMAEFTWRAQVWTGDQVLGQLEPKGLNAETLVSLLVQP